MITRLQRRWSTMRAFAATGLTLPDRFELAFAGFARHRPFGGDSLYARAGRAVCGAVTPRVAPAGGARLRLDLTGFVDPMIYEEIFVDGIYPLEVVPFAPDLVVDCGACHGMFTLLARSRFPAARLVAFEPEPTNFARLQENLALNSPGPEAVRAAVGPAAGHVRFTGSGFGGHILGAEETGDIEVEVVSLPEFLRQARPQNLVLKLDIEGAERELLPAIVPQLPSKTVIFLETHHDPTICAAYLQPCLKAGFVDKIIRSRPPEPGKTAEYVERLLMRHP